MRGQDALATAGGTPALRLFEKETGRTMTIPAEKIAVEKAADKPAEKPIEKRRALGRGLESLLGGPRVVTAPASDSTLAPRARTDGALALDGVHNPQEVRGQDAPSTSSGQALATASLTPALPEPGSVA